MKGPHRATTERREWIREAVARGWPEWRIYKVAREKFGVTDRRIREDLHLLSEEFRRDHDDPQAQERAVGAIISRMLERARKLDEKGKHVEAAQVDMMLLKIWGFRSPRWSHQGEAQVNIHGPAVVQTGGGRWTQLQRELEGLSDEELAARLEAAQRRLQGIGILRARPAGEAEPLTIDAPREAADG